PCEVQAFLQASCTACHTTPLAGNAPMPLTSYAELVAASPSGASFADRALARVKAGTMPPGTALPTAQYEAFEAWVNAGAPTGACEGGGGDDPLNAAPICTSGVSVLRCDGEDEAEARFLSPLPKEAGCELGENMNPGRACVSCHEDARFLSPLPKEAGCELGENMNPGRACVSCHEQTIEDAPPLWFGGTVYPTGHEPELCQGGPPGSEAATVVITDANDAEFRRSVNASGNFLLRRSEVASFAFPLRAKVVYQGRERAMATPQMIGDCNACHTQQGDNGAPGRITLP
ncbi:MAG: hypothetical protein MUF34_33860, partial [Polyangiaceae bacterium]|nr:hypothetical protein [Polyangiaceae bacterium]